MRLRGSTRIVLIALCALRHSPHHLRLLSTPSTLVSAAHHVRGEEANKQCQRHALSRLNPTLIRCVDLARVALCLQAQVAQFLAIFPTVRAARVRELIDACTGNIDQAVELYLVQGDSVAESVAPPARARNSAAPAAAAASAAVDDDDDEVMLSERPAATSSAAASSARKRKEAAAPSSKAAAPSPIVSPSKRAKGKGAASKEANQHSLALFFQKSPVATAAAAAAAPSKNGSSAAGSTLSKQMDESARSQRRLASPTIHDSSDASSTAAAAAASSSTSHAAATSFSAVAAAAAPTFLSLADNLAPSAASSATDPLRPCWLPGAPVPFLFLSRLFHLIEGENGRIKITNWLAYGFWQILAYTPADLPAALFLASDQLAPSYLNHQMGVGGSMLVKLVSEMTGVPHAKLSADHQRLGDLGLIAAQYRLTQTLLFRPAPLGVAQVFNSFYSLADINKRDRKEMLLVSAQTQATEDPRWMRAGTDFFHLHFAVLAFVQKKLFAAARESELTYLIRIAEGGLRIGAVVTTVLSALAKAFVLHHLHCEGVPEERRHEVCTFERVLKATEIVKGAAKAGIIPFALNPVPADASPAALAASIARRLPSHLAHATAKLRRAYSELPNFHAIMPVLLKSPIAIYELHKYIQLTAGVPIKPQLGKPLTSQKHTHSIEGEAPAVSRHPSHLAFLFALCARFRYRSNAQAVQRSSLHNRNQVRWPESASASLGLWSISHLLAPSHGPRGSMERSHTVHRSGEKRTRASKLLHHRRGDRGH